MSPSLFKINSLFHGISLGYIGVNYDPVPLEKLQALLIPEGNMNFISAVDSRSTLLYVACFLVSRFSTLVLEIPETVNSNVQNHVLWAAFILKFGLQVIIVWTMIHVLLRGQHSFSALLFASVPWLSYRSFQLFNLDFMKWRAVWCIAEASLPAFWAWQTAAWLCKQ